MRALLLLLTTAALGDSVYPGTFAGDRIARVSADILQTASMP